MLISAIILLIFSFDNKLSLNSNFLALRAQLNNCLLVVNFAHASSVTFEYSANNDDFFTNKLVSHKSILVCYSSIRGLLHEFSSKYFNIAVILYENSILLDVVLVP